MAGWSGVNTAILSPSGGSVGIGFDIPADVVAQRLQAADLPTARWRAAISAPTVQLVTDEIAESLGVKGKKGALVAVA